MGDRRKQKLLDVFNQQDGKCYICGGTMTLALGRPNTAEIEHIIPKYFLQAIKHRDYSLGGFNIAAAGHLCNSLKAGKSLSEVSSDLRNKRLCDWADGREARVLALVA